MANDIYIISISIWIGLYIQTRQMNSYPGFGMISPISQMELHEIRNKYLRDIIFRMIPLLCLFNLLCWLASSFELWALVMIPMQLIYFYGNYINTRNNYIRRVYGKTPKRVVYPMPEKTIFPSDKDICDENACAICLENYQLGDKLSPLKCVHYFHQECLRQWYVANGNCPLCRQ